ncbi:MAG: alpha-L-fucosidase [Candidatus Omnitrophota bacterium]
MKPNWFYDHIRQVHLDWILPEFPKGVLSQFDPEKFVRELTRAHVNYVSLYAKCHFGNSYYYTRVGYRHSGLKKDILKEAGLACRKHKIKTSAYYSLCGDNRAWDEHEDWRFLDAEGKSPPLGQQFRLVCPNSPYSDELALPQLEEVAAGYPVDGFFIDIPFVTPLVCYCRYCRERYNRDTGRELTPDLPESERLRFQQLTAARFMKRLKKIIVRRNPEMLIACNQAWKPEYAREFSEVSDCGVVESHPHYCSFLSHSRSARWARTLPKPVQVMTSRFTGGWGETTIKPEAQLLSEVSLLIGNGAPASIGDQLKIDGTLEKPVYDLFGKCFSFVLEREPLLLGARSVKHCALLIPCRRRDEALPGVMPVISGAAKILQENHIQYDILNALDIEKLDSYKIAVMPEPGGYSEKALKRLRDFVRGGGILVAEGDALLADGKFAMADVFGIEYRKPSVYSHGYYKLRPQIRNDSQSMPLNVRAKTFEIKAKQAGVLADLHFPVAEYDPERAFRSEYAPPVEEPAGYPFITVNVYGKGTAVYIAGNIFRLYWNTNHHWLRRLIESLLDYLCPEPPFRIEATPLIEANLMKKGKYLLLNLMQYQLGTIGDPGAPAVIEKVMPVKRIKCSVKTAKVKEITLEPEHKRIRFISEGGYVHFIVPQLQYLTMVRMVQE